MNINKAYSILNINQNKDISEVKKELKKYRNNKLKEFHPDIYNGEDANSKTDKIIEAYQFIENYNDSILKNVEPKEDNNLKYDSIIKEYSKYVEEYFVLYASLLDTDYSGIDEISIKIFFDTYKHFLFLKEQIRNIEDIMIQKNIKFTRCEFNNENFTRQYVLVIYNISFHFINNKIWDVKEKFLKKKNKTKLKKEYYAIADIHKQLFLKYKDYLPISFVSKLLSKDYIMDYLKSHE